MQPAHCSRLEPQPPRDQVALDIARAFADDIEQCVAVDATAAVGVNADVAEANMVFVFGADPNTKLVVAAALRAVYCIGVASAEMRAPSPHSVRHDAPAEMDMVVVEPVTRHA